MSGPLLPEFQRMAGPDRFRAYYEILEEEAAQGHPELGPELDGYFQAYTGGFGEYQKRPFARTRIIRIRGMVTLGIQEIIEAKGDRRASILDAGCGIGTESIFFALVGGAVHGVDLRESRLAVAQARKEYFERRLGRSLNATFEFRNVVEIPEPEKYDGIFVQEAISHIDPVDEFLAASWRLLRPGGRIVIHDPNGLNPYKRFHAWKERGGQVYETVTDPKTGFQFRQADERFLSVVALQKMLRNARLEVCRVIMTGFFPVRLYKRATWRTLDNLERLFQKTPLLSILGGYYIVEAEKPHD